MALKNLDQLIEEHLGHALHKSLAARLKRSLTQINSDKISNLELTILIKQFLLATNTRKVSVPSDIGWPSLENWKEIGCDADVIGEGIKLTSQKKIPPWFPEDNQLIDVFQKKERRASAGLAGSDPWLSELGHSKYKTFGQKKAVRLIYESAPGSTNIVVLPTGSGKTTAFFGPASLANPKLSVLVVPTVSLALDLERRLKEDLGYEESAAYHGGLNENEKKEFLGNVRSNRKWIVITNPESLFGPLEKAIRDQADNGNLKYFGIDEAHIVAGWGHTFRPEFQFLSGFCNKLRELSKDKGEEIRLILFTGTLDQYSFDVLEKLFSSPGKTNLVSAQETRQEPSYYVEKCETSEEKKEKLLQALTCLPRPLIIYTTLISDQPDNGYIGIEGVKGWLEEEGYKRYKIVTGTGNSFSSTPSPVAIKNIQCQGEESEDIDIVLATSAFGLGIDIPDIRTVIHVCIPQSIERFYQEVGRSGRDGRASASLLLYEDVDIRQAAGMVKNNNALLDDTAWERWKKMLNTSKAVNEKISQVNLTSATDTVEKPDSDFNYKWNFYTLSKMALGGLIKIGWKETSEMLGELDEDERRREIQKLNKWVSITRLKDNLLDKDFFVTKYKKERNSADKASKKSLERLENFANGVNNSNLRICPNKIFSESLELVWRETERLRVWSSCGGCWVCGYKPRTHTSIPDVLTHSKTPYLLSTHDDVAKLLNVKRKGAITYPANIPPWADIGELIEKLHDDCQVRHLVLPNGMNDWEKLEINSSRKWIKVDDFSAWVNTPFPEGIGGTTLVVLPVHSQLKAEEIKDLASMKVKENSGLFVILPEGMKDLDPRKEPLWWKFGKQTNLESAIKEWSK